MSYKVLADGELVDEVETLDEGLKYLNEWINDGLSVDLYDCIENENGDIVAYVDDDEVIMGSYRD